ncbi:MAG: hypothetical protein KDA24_22130, partial [Deltaproteobacteria bacterium]|nr:hypothetical protein [Deltaproteobacteria bacterium]
SGGDDDDSAGDDDDSAGDDDDSAGDDDDSAGDDDDSAGDDDDSASTARSGPFEEQVFASDAPASPVDLLARDGVLYALGGNTVAVLDPETGDSTDTFSLTGIGAALAGSSTDDGYVYVALEDLGQVAILSHGPFLEITSISDTTVDSSDEIEVTLVAGAPATSGTCALSATVGGTIAGDGTAATLDLDEAELGATTVVTIAADALEEGASRVHLFCGDEGAQGRASFSYYLGDLEAPESFTVVAANGRVTASWMDNDDEAVVSYDLLFSTTAFSDGDVPTESNSDNSVTSPHSVSAPDTIGEETVTVEVDSLVNGTTYYFAVAAVDGEGSRGPYSEIAATTPNVTGGVAALTGDPGCTCAYPASGGGGRAAFALLPLMLLAALRRRRTGVRR